MQKRQRNILMNFSAVIIVTIIAVVAMINLRAWINRSEAMRAMEHLGKIVLDYRSKYNSVPPQSYVDDAEKKLIGSVRLGQLNYRALWIDFGASPEEVLAYTEKDYHSLFVGSGFVVLRLDGSVQWLPKQEFEKLLSKQQSPEELQMISEKY
ncbi:MAG: hypothetical protein KAI59_03650 [Planctomycetes bacterium]|nr:hypothetical protein [Planctomycetota bacterium]MCK5473101.1 hypothetical protein [Planctomycetota bacterium]